MIRGYHVYYKFENTSRTKSDEYEVIDILAQLASILYWKENYGPIRLIANQQYFDSILKYRIFEEYDGIDLYMLDQMPFKDKASTYWSFSKIFAAYQLSKMHDEFCIFDVDLWIKDKNLIDKGFDFHAFHKENFDINSTKNVYYEPINWMDQTDVDKFNWNYWPLNTAIFHFKNRTKEITENWYNESIKVIIRDKEMEDDIKKHSSIFIEQRLLPVIAKKLGISYGTIKPNIYRSSSNRENISWSNKWVPAIDSSLKSNEIENSITHIWGGKFYYTKPIIRINFLEKILNDLSRFDGIKEKYRELFDEANLLLEQSYKELKS